MNGDPLAVMKARLSALKPEFEWNPENANWSESARSALIEAIGVVDQPWPEPSLECGQPIEEDGYRRLRVEFPSHLGWSGRGWLLIPDGLDARVPAVVCVPGHGVGVDAIVGLVEEPYQSNFAIQSVKQGWVVLAIEQVSFGTNKSSRDADKYSSCVTDSMAALLLGETVPGWRVRDAIASVRALATHPLVDPDRTGIMGISGGGLTALWAAALEPKFLATGVSGYFCPMAHSILNVDHCPDNYVPGFGTMMDVPDLAGLVAPRWLAVENGTEDPIFEAAGFLSGCELATRIYLHHDVPERFSSDLFEGDHVFHGTALIAHFKQAFA